MKTRVVNPASPRFAAPIADAFIAALKEKGLLDQSSVDRLNRARGASSVSSIILIQQLGLVAEDELVRVLCDVTGLDPARKYGDRLSPGDDASRLSAKFLKNIRAVPLDLPNGRLGLAMADPLDDAAAEAIAYKLERPLIRLVAAVSEIDAALAEPRETPTAETAHDGAPSAADLEALQDLASGAPVIRLISAIIEKASVLKASDIHFEPTETHLRVRMRINGALQDMDPVHYSMRTAALSRLKVMARLDISETRLPQDGRAKIAVRGRDIDLRVSTAPTLHGESIVVRLLDRSSVALDLRALGFSDGARETFLAALAQPNGLVFVSGPTGSGKTTTLYAALLTLNDPKRKLFSVEDPVEYRIDGVNQVQVNPKIGLTFATALRSLLRQDPDVMMVGEIRDPETAEIAVQAALTGHLVLATIHTNSAAATVTRLLDMGVEDYLIGTCAAGFVAQRLVGTLCPSCADRAPAPVALLQRYGVELSPSARVGRAVGCPDCRGSGFAGRTTICEVIRVTPEIEEAIARRASAAEIEKLAISQGMRTMARDGLEKALAGITTVEEVLRAVRA